MSDASVNDDALVEVDALVPVLFGLEFFTMLDGFFIVFSVWQLYIYIFKRGSNVGKCINVCLSMSTATATAPAPFSVVTYLSWNERRILFLEFFIVIDNKLSHRAKCNIDVFNRSIIEPHTIFYLKEINLVKKLYNATKRQCLYLSVFTI